MGDNISAEEANAFGKAVLDRFSNPFLEHKWASIALQFTLKMKIRSLPLIINAFEKTGQLPINMLLGFSAYFVQMKIISHTDSTSSLVDALADVDTWGRDLNQLPGLTKTITEMVSSIINDGITKTLNKY